MMFESSSPFDEALSKPFLGEPAKKKWSLLSSSTSSTVATMFNEFYEDSGDDESESSGGYEAPDIEEETIVFATKNNKTAPSINSVLEEGLQVMDVEAALIKERHGSFVEMHQSMSQILEIQNDLSALIDSQEDDIENLQSMSIEASEQAQAGVKHLLRINNQRELMQQRRAYLLLTFLMVVSAYWVFGSAENNSEGSSIVAP